MEIIQKYFPELSKIQVEKFRKMESVYRYWNEKVNVISRKDIDFLFEKHILHSLSIAKYINFKDNTTILDVGTGGGFPGIPLAILFPNCHFTLIDSIQKKIKVTQEISRELGLENIRSVHGRVEKHKGKYDFVVSRAVTSFPKFVSLVKYKISKTSCNELKNGIIYLKGGEFEAEINPFRKSIRIFSIDTLFNEEFFETKKIVYLPLISLK